MFGHDLYNDACEYNKQALHEVAKNFGEIDAFVQLTFFHAGEAVALVQFDLQHSGAGRRSCLKSGTDLYKGCGRVKHEMYDVKPGPFQIIVVDSRQASDKHDIIRSEDKEFGGNKHFDIKVFQNCGVLGHDNPLKTYKAEDFDSRASDDQYSRYVKHAVLDNAIAFMQGKRAVQGLKSNLPDHSIPAHLMSAIYMSSVNRKLGLNPIISMDLDFESRKFIFVAVETQLLTCFGNIGRAHFGKEPKLAAKGRKEFCTII